MLFKIIKILIDMFKHSCDLSKSKVIKFYFTTYSPIYELLYHKLYKTFIAFYSMPYENAILRNDSALQCIFSALSLNVHMYMT